MSVSCSSDPGEDIFDKENTTKMSFGVSEGTRARITNSLNKFVVYGDVTDPSSESDAPSVIFDKTNVEYIDNNWYYTDPQYWEPYCAYSFVALYPGAVIDDDSRALYSDSHLSFIYSLPIGDDNMVKESEVQDIVVATHRRLYDSINLGTTVFFSFNHLLSMINISPALEDNVMSDDDYLELRKMEVTGINTEARFDIYPASRVSGSMTDDRVIEITGQKGEGALRMEFAEPVKVTNHSGHINLFGSEDAVIMLPQKFDSDSEAKIILSYSTNRNPEVKQIIIPLKSMTWEYGKCYTYRFSINRTGAKFETTTITDWEIENSGNINAF